MSILTYRCLQCDDKVLWHEEAWVCAGCKAKYPQVAYSPIFTPNPTLYLAQCFAELYRDHQQNRRDLAQAIKKNAKRSIAFFGALTANNELLTPLLHELEPHFTKQELLDVVDSQRNLAYTTRLDYLKRDWAWQPENEEEISIMVDTLSEHLRTHSMSGKAVFMGGGMGRVAVELAPSFEKVFIVDYSLTMAFLFSKLSEGDINFQHITRKNLKNREEIVKEMTASCQSPIDSHHRLADIKDKVHYLLGQADNTPFLSKSVDVFYSIYFSDVLPLSQYLPEVMRVLKPGGYFVHFGPLEYHFDDTENMKSVDEFIHSFEQKGFEPIVHDFVESGHIDSKESMFNKRYNNAVLVMRWNPKTIHVDKTSVLRLAQDYTITTRIRKESGAPETSLAFENGNEYEGAGSMVRILEALDGHRNIRQVLDFVGMVEEGSEELLIQIFTDLLESGILVLAED